VCSSAEKLQTTIQLEFVGESAAVKALGGTLVKTLAEVEVECLPVDLPHNLVVDITSLATFEDVITVKDITLPKGVEMLTDLEETVAKIQPPRDVEAELSTPVVEDVTKVEGVVKPEADADVKSE
jgi:large subunit ribosomal protein L25